jgi:YD repeat-containing protein
MRLRVWAGLFVFALLLCGSLPSAQGQPIRYVYDELGRLISVIDQNGDAATYQYDAVGNLTGITRTSAGSVAIFEFTPNGAPVGTSITLHGVGFSATPGQNSVSFNGTSATVISATTTTLVVAVPTGATTGTISVTSPTGSATAGPFMVTTSTAPTITAISPGTGVTNTAVTVSGTNFDAVPANTKTRFNGGVAPQTSVTATTLNVTVPAGRGSGRISVDTPSGRAVSATDFIIPPAPYTTADVNVSGRLSYDTATTVSVSTANKIGLWLFDGAVGRRVSLRGTSGMSGQVAGCDVTVSLLRPDTSVQGSTCMESSGFLDLTTLLSTDTYTILLDPGGTATGSVTLTLHNVPADDIESTSPGGGPVTVSTTIPGQNAAVTFSGTAGQRVSLVGSGGMAGQIVGCDVNASIINPDGSVLAPASCMESSGFIDAMTLPTTGTYRIVVDPVSFATGSVTLTLNNVPADYTGSITAGGSVTVTTSPAGQNAAVTFSGTLGQRISLKGTSGMSGQVVGCDVNVTIKKPDGSVLAPAACMESSGFIDVQTLPVAGTYTIVVDPVAAATGSLTLWLYDVPADTTGTVSVGGSAVSVPLSTAGQNGTLTFSGTASQQVTVRMTGNTFGSTTVKLMKPDGTQLTTGTSTLPNFNLTTQTLPATGTYTIVVDPAAGNTGTINVSVTNP